MPKSKKRSLVLPPIPLPRKADGDTVPLLRETMTLMPVSTKGTENSTTSDLSSLIVREPIAMSARLDTTWWGKRLITLRTEKVQL